jgi:aspartate/methionine/tyrosine aminotransferase
MQYKRMPIEVESPEEMGYGNIKYNLAESSVRDRRISDINANLSDLVLNYGDHRGMHELRNLICENSHQIDAKNVLVTQAAAMALFVINSSLLTASDHLIVLRPNYATNIETPRAIGCEISYIDLTFDAGYSIDIELVKSFIKSNTKLISITTPHNPTGTVIPENTIEEIIKIAEEHNCYLLIDETYRELNFQTKLKPYYAEKSSKVISVSSISKAYGFPGLRIGWIICKDAGLMNLFLAAKEQIIICNSIVDEYLALQILKNKSIYLKASHLTLNSNFLIVKNWIENHQYLEWIESTVGAVCFVRIKSGVGINSSSFYEALFDQFETIVGPGHWFEQSDQYFRLGFGFPYETELIFGLTAIDKCIEFVLR